MKPVFFSRKRAEFLRRRLDDKSRPLHVVGLGSFGGNIALIRWLAARGHQIMLWESKPLAALSDSWERLDDAAKNVEARFEAANPALPADDLVLLTPAVEPGSAFLKGRSAEMISTEIEISLMLLADAGSLAHVVTGSVGKSTCASLMAAALGCPVLGNIGRSPLENEALPPAEAVLEISSAQLHYLRPSAFVPSTFLLTPLAKNHADWHGSLEAYHSAKLSWIEKWRGTGVPGCAAMDALPSRPALRIEKNRLLIDGLPGRAVDLDTEFLLPGKHNRANLLLVLRQLSTWKGLSQELVDRALAFPGLPHRLEVVSRRRGCRFINDSKATSPEAVLMALDCARPGAVLILQGVFKAADFSAVFRKVEQSGSELRLLGGLRRLEPPASCRCGRHESLAALFRDEDLAALSGRDVLFSPGAPSYDQYRNYEARGDDFKRLAKGLGE